MTQNRSAFDPEAEQDPGERIEAAHYRGQRFRLRLQG